jgi:hypothetical protein
MRKRFYLALLVLAVILLALPGLAAKAVKRLTRHPRRLAWRLPRSIASMPASRPNS